MSKRSNTNLNTTSNVNTEVGNDPVVVLTGEQTEQIVEQVMTGETVNETVNEQTEVERPVEESIKVKLSKMNAPAVIEHFGGISKAIRGLTNLGYTRGEVAKMTGKKYQHVRNVLITPLTSKTTA